MRAVVQRVASARAIVEGATAGEIGAGLCVLVGVARGDGVGEAERLAGRIARLRIFPDAEGLRALGVSVETGVFGASMQVELVNDGPVTIVLG
jgi:D-tyrosyl-tRNA(Tyr) deacylase